MAAGTGSEIQTPMAIVILCGLTTSTLLNMIDVNHTNLVRAMVGSIQVPRQDISD